MTDDLQRCCWVDMTKPYYVAYHDIEWGVPVHNDNKHFEILSLECFQAGLSWDTILKKRDGFREAFKHFDPKIVASLSDDYLEQLMHNTQIVRHRNKIWSMRTNAQAFLEIQKKFKSFNTFIYSQIGGKQIVNKWRQDQQAPAKTDLSTEISTCLKGYGMKFAGPVTVYSYLQAAGLINDHTVSCFRHKTCFRT